MCEKPIRLADIIGDSITDGPGIRATVFVQGCHHHCEGCHNPTTWDPAGGADHTWQEIWQRISKNPLMRGVTFSGGEPFEQAEALLPLAKEIRSRGLELAIYTGGLFEDILKRGGSELALLEQAQILVDGPFILKQRNLLLKFRGSENQRIIDVKRSLEAGRAVIDSSDRWN
ncbi:anaerobic ribonucleoside-triphosphate reductase activating protein [Acidaminobacterium chupaoyuni]